MSDAPPPPPRRTDSRPSSSSAPATPDQSGWKARMKARGMGWGKVAMDKGVKISDNLGGKVNDIAEKRFGTEAFWPVTGDFPKEMDKAARILRAFTVDGVVTEAKVEEDGDPKKKKKVKVIRKIPPAVIANAKGLAIFTSMRTGFAPFGGAGGAGVVVSKLPDGTWSAPASMSPNNLTAGFLIGVDVYDCVLVIRSQKALDSFKTHKVTLGAELAVVAGPYGAGAAVESGIEKAPLFSYVRSRGVYAGVEVVGQVFVSRFDENAAMYHWPGIKAGDILAGKVRIPGEAAALQKALQDAESGKAQKEKGDALDIVIPEGAAELDLNDGEVLKLPPTPDQTTGHEHESDPETEIVHSPSHPGSHNPSMTDLKAPQPRRLIPPPLPSRNQNRPALVHQHSSASHYSDAVDETHHVAAAPLNDDLPSYTDPYGAATDRYPSDEKAGAIPSDTVNDDGDVMTESERREWEQFIEEHKREQAAAAEAATTAPVTTATEQTAVDEGGIAQLSHRLQEQTFGETEKDKAKEEDSLR